MSKKEKESIQLLQGTLDLIILRTLATMGPQHAYQSATRLRASLRSASQPQPGHSLYSVSATGTVRVD